MAERRQKVAELYLRRWPQSEIAAEVGVTQAQVCREIQAILADYRRAREDHIDREVAELAEMERACADLFAETKEREWVSERRGIKERRAKLLGLDAPAKVAATNPEGDGPQEIRLRWDDYRSTEAAENDPAAAASREAE